MSEKLKNSVNYENIVELEKAGPEYEKSLVEQIEKRAETSNSENESRKLESEAHREALEYAEPKDQEKLKKAEQPNPEKPTRISKRDLDIQFKRTMVKIQKDMTPSSRAFSKVIHNPVVDKASQAVGSTIARPNLILAGGIGTLTIGLLVYLVAKNYGYVLSGFESIATFIFGWLIGALVEFARVGFKNKRM